ncbi:ATP synthase F1 subunit delta [Pareuzebyella sediminis]|uniref:ATP synthase F1 subunit delta n=1 Tax=Pareuzebyella sediminis TaxID=2607998 RepID=UPI0011EC5F78|nr:ATP synthase F1 subunit delta [Pareuzebyella sediminis]
MSESRAALRYAKAVLDLAVSEKSADAVESDMRSIVSTISDSKDLRNMLGNPVVSGQTKKEALKLIFRDSNVITVGLIDTLTSNRRIPLLNEVALKYIILHEDLKGKGVAYVTTAVPLSGALEKKVLKQVAQLTGNEVAIENKIDESIIGGFILRVGDLQYDASISNKLNNLKREFTNSL